MKRISILIILSSLLTPLVASSPVFAKARLQSITVTPKKVIGGQPVLVTITFNGRGLAIPVVETNAPNIVPWSGAIPNNDRSVITTTVQTNEVNGISRAGLFASWDGRRVHVVLELYPKPVNQAPILSSPDNYAVVYSPHERLSWSSVDRVHTYEICILPDGSTTCSSNVTTSATNLYANLENFRGKLVYWKIRGRNYGPNGLAMGPWSSRRSLRVTLPAARLAWPANNAWVNTLRPQFRWQPVDGADTYQIELTGPNNHKQTYTVYKGSTAFRQRRFTPPANKQLPVAGKWTWSVNATNSSVTAFGQPSLQPLFDQVRSMTIRLSPVKRK